MKSAVFFLSFTAVLAGMIALELQPNKYIANILFLLKFWLVFLMFIIWMGVALWSSKVPSQSSINMAIQFTKDEKWPWWRKTLNWIAKMQLIAIAVIALPLGQWMIFISTLAMIVGGKKLKPTAQSYLSKMHIDLDKKNAVIEV